MKSSTPSTINKDKKTSEENKLDYVVLYMALMLAIIACMMAVIVWLTIIAWKAVLAFLIVGFIIYKFIK